MVGFVLVNRNRLASFEDFLKQFGVILLLNLGIGVIFDSVDLSAHVGGLIIGLIGGYICAKSRNFKYIYLVISIVTTIFLYNYLVGVFSSKILLLN